MNEPKPPTYELLVKNLNGLPIEKRIETATIYVSDTDEYYPIKKLRFVGDEQSALDDGHLIIEV